MADFFGTCSVVQAGAGVDGGEGPNPVIYIILTDLAGSFPAGTQFYASDSGKREMLAVALAAISGQKKVTVIAQPPNPGNSPYTPIFRLYLQNQPL
jgi:hypothetical protein